MNAGEQYSDLFSIKNFLAQKTLASIMLCNEPVAAIEFSNEGDVVTLKPYKRLKGLDFSGNFRLSQGIRQIDQALDDLSAVISTDRAFLERQTLEDIDSGVYEGCEAEPGKAG